MYGPEELSNLLTWVACLRVARVLVRRCLGWMGRWQWTVRVHLVGVLCRRLLRVALYAVLLLRGVLAMRSLRVRRRSVRPRRKGYPLSRLDNLGPGQVPHHRGL